MTKSEVANDESIPNDEIRITRLRFVIRVSDLIRHSDFAIRH